MTSAARRQRALDIQAAASGFASPKDFTRQCFSNSDSFDSTDSESAAFSDLEPESSGVDWVASSVSHSDSSEDTSGEATSRVLARTRRTGNPVDVGIDEAQDELAQQTSLDADFEGQELDDLVASLPQGADSWGNPGTAAAGLAGQLDDEIPLDQVSPSIQWQVAAMLEQFPAAFQEDLAKLGRKKATTQLLVQITRRVLEDKSLDPNVASEQSIGAGPTQVRKTSFPTEAVVAGESPWLDPWQWATDLGRHAAISPNILCKCRILHSQGQGFDLQRLFGVYCEYLMHDITVGLSGPRALRAPG